MLPIFAIHRDMGRGRIEELEAENKALREACAAAAFVIWGCGDEKIIAAEDKFKAIMDKLKVTW